MATRGRRGRPRAVPAYEEEMRRAMFEDEPRAPTPRRDSPAPPVPPVQPVPPPPPPVDYAMVMQGIVQAQIQTQAQAQAAIQAQMQAQLQAQLDTQVSLSRWL
jgi:hypothetical protein